MLLFQVITSKIIEMKKIEISEKYRKYLIQIKLHDNSYYTVWGTDMNDNENDKMLVKNNKLVLFYKIGTLKKKLFEYKGIFSDENNFENWIGEESFEESYSTTDLTCLCTFSELDLKNNKVASDIIDSLNIILDFYIQIKKNKRVFCSKLLLDFKDNLYNNHCWKNDGLVFPFNDVTIIKIQGILKKIYDDFVKQIEFIV